MSEKDAGPGDVRNDDPDRQNRVDAGRHQDDGHLDATIDYRRRPVGR